MITLYVDARYINITGLSYIDAAAVAGVIAAGDQSFDAAVACTHQVQFSVHLEDITVLNRRGESAVGFKPVEVKGSRDTGRHGQCRIVRCGCDVIAEGDFLALLKGAVYQIPFG